LSQAPIQITEEISALIPDPMREFVKRHANYAAVDEARGIIDLELSGSAGPTFYFPKKPESKLTARFTLTLQLSGVMDYVRSKLSDEAHIQTAIRSFEDMWNELTEAVKKAGYGFVYSHDMNMDCYGYWDVLLPLHSWNEKTFVAVCMAVNAFDQKFAKWEEALLSSK
jgi:hypothetical protein